MMKLIKNGKVLQNGELQQADILIDGKVIKQIAPAIEPSNGVDIIDAKGHFVSPDLSMFMFIYANLVVNIKRQLKLVLKLLLEVDLQLYVQCLTQDRTRFCRTF